jgi:hypothetical protein
VPQALLNYKLNQVNISVIAESAGSTIDIVQNTLAGLRDEILDSVILKKVNVQLDFGIGTLLLTNQSVIQFRSALSKEQPTEKVEDKIPALKEFGDNKALSDNAEELRNVKRRSSVAQDRISETGQSKITERNINHMQQMQACRQSQTSQGGRPLRNI